MKAAVYHRYGPAEAVHLTDLPTPAPGRGQILIRVHASSVTTADWRLRASAFPGALWLPGRLMTGLFAPRNPVLGMEVAGEVVAKGHAVTRFEIGQRVFGFCGGGGHAEFVALTEDGALLQTPDQLSDAEAVALPFGALCALSFLRDVARLRPGQRVLITGGSGGVGVYAIQMAKALGAHVTACASRPNLPLLHALGADDSFDYRAETARIFAPYDVIFDTVGALDWPRARDLLRRSGLFLPLNFAGRELWHLLRARLSGGPRLRLHVNEDRAEDLQTVLEMVVAGTLRPVIDRRFDLDEITAAHRYVEARHRKGAVVVDVLPRRADSLVA